MSNKIIIESDIPMPKKGDGARSEVGKAVQNLKVGQSFVLPKDFKVTALFRYGVIRGYKLTTRKQPNGRQRVWRVA